MIDIKTIIAQGEKRFQEAIANATQQNKGDATRINRRTNETYSNRLTRACLGVSQNIELNERMYALCAAVPELLLAGMYRLGYGNSREETKKHNYTPPKLLADYYTNFKDELFIKDANIMIDNIKNNKIDKVLICHGLSAIDDTILLLADIGRSVRVSQALGINDFQVLLADVSWVKHNRSLNQTFEKKEMFVDSLRICLDKRKRLYDALGLKCSVFGISDYGKKDEYINRTSLEKVTHQCRELAKVLWGDKSLEPHDTEIKKVIGTSFDKLKNNNKIPNYIKTLISINESMSKTFEDSLQNELMALRTISELFSTFDEDIFVYYFAQYFAQNSYTNYLKLANISEQKFDFPFLQKSPFFDNVLNGTVKSKSQSDNIYQIYFPWYILGKYKLLPYTSVSGDVLKSNQNIQKYYDETILLEDYKDASIKKISKTLEQTSIGHRNRLLCDILSFIHILAGITEINNDIWGSLESLSPEISNQIRSTEDNIDSVKSVYSDWIQALTKDNTVVPYHLMPYLWDDTDWNDERLQICSKLFQQVLQVVHNICE